MKITYLKSLNAVQKNNLYCIPEFFRQALKELTIEEQADCIYIRSSDQRSVHSVSYSIDTSYPTFYTKLSESKDVYEFIVFDNIILEVKAVRGKTITFTKPFSASYESTRQCMFVDSQYRELRNVTTTEHTFYTLVLFMMHNKMKPVIERYRNHYSNILLSKEATISEIEDAIEIMKWLHQDDLVLKFCEHLLSVDYCLGCKYLADYHKHNEDKKAAAQWYLNAARKGDLPCISELYRCVTFFHYYKHEWTYNFLEELLVIAKKYSIKDIEDKTEQAISVFNRGQ